MGKGKGNKEKHKKKTRQAESQTTKQQERQDERKSKRERKREKNNFNVSREDNTDDVVFEYQQGFGMVIPGGLSETWNHSDCDKQMI